MPNIGSIKRYIGTVLGAGWKGVSQPGFWKGLRCALVTLKRGIVGCVVKG